MLRYINWELVLVAIAYLMSMGLILKGFVDFFIQMTNLCIGYGFSLSFLLDGIIRMGLGVFYAVVLILLMYWTYVMDEKIQSNGKNPEL
jgi:membrane protein implicated in regulation of membrane protease activity